MGTTWTQWLWSCPKCGKITRQTFAVADAASAPDQESVLARKTATTPQVQWECSCPHCKTAVQLATQVRSLQPYNQDVEESAYEIVDIVSTEFPRHHVKSNSFLKDKLEAWIDVLAEERCADSLLMRKRVVSKFAWDHIVGFGPLEDLITDPTTMMIYVHGPKHIFAQRHGILEETNFTFRNEKHLRDVITDLIHPDVFMPEMGIQRETPDGANIKVYMDGDDLCLMLKPAPCLTRPIPPRT